MASRLCTATESQRFLNSFGGYRDWLGGLRELGVQRGDRVAFLGLNSDRYCEYYLAVPWADATVNPVNIRWTTGRKSLQITG